MNTDQTRKRNENRFELLRELQHHGPLRRLDLSSRCKIRKSSASSIIDELIDARILRNVSEQHPRSPICFTSGQWHIGAASIRSRSIEFCRVEFDGQLVGLFRRELPAGASTQNLLDILISGFETILDSSSVPLIGLGVAAPGIIDPHGGKTEFSINIPQLNNAPVAAILQQLFSIPVAFDHAMRASLWGGSWFEPELAKYRNIVYLEIGTGIGSALVLNGIPHVGSTYSAGEIGHIAVGNEGRHCRCGKLDCLETYCGINAILADINTRTQPTRTFSSVNDILAAQDDRIVRNVLNQAMQRLAQLLSSLIGFIDPQALLLGNQNEEFYQLLLPMLKRHLLATTQETTPSKLHIGIAPTCPNAALRGIAGIVLRIQITEGLTTILDESISTVYDN